MKKITSPILEITLLGALSVIATSASADIGYQFVTVGNPGNANDPATGSLYGGVSYTYDIGAYDVTLNQYATFLNAVARSDPYQLYNTFGMAATGNPTGASTGAGITQSGASGSFAYSVIGSSGNNPIGYISWLDAARFANWMQNGQPTGLGEVAASTEQGAYTLNGDTTSGLETKNGNALYWIPSENEWYKAAFYDPNKGGPGVGGYWAYATKSNTTPGNVVGNGTNEANYNNGVWSVTQSSSFSSSQNYVTNVGAFTNSASAYGTYDQNGDVWNWNDAVVGSSRGLRGSSSSSPSNYLLSSGRDSLSPVTQENDVGFRLATVPEPTAATSLIFAGALLFARRKRAHS